jgi:hypothetical protein
MDKWNTFKTYVKSPPPELIAQVEYRSAFLSALGILAVTTILILKGLWWVIFAFVFQLGSLWANGMSAYARYKVFMSLRPEETYEYVLSDISFTRRRGRLIKLRYSAIMRWLILPCSFIVVIGFTGIQRVTADWIFRIKGIPILMYSDYLMQVAVWTILFYFIFTYVIIGGLIEYMEKEKVKKKKELKREDGVKEKVN